MLYFNFYSFAIYTLTWEITSVFHQYILMFVKPRTPHVKCLFHSITYRLILPLFTGWRCTCWIKQPTRVDKLRHFWDDAVHPRGATCTSRRRNRFLDFQIYCFFVFTFFLAFTSSFWICIFYLLLYNGRKPYLFVNTSRTTLPILYLVSLSPQPYTM